MVIPMKSQYEQQCNAAALKEMGIPVINSLKKKHYQSITDWINYGKVIPVNYPDNTEAIIKRIVMDHFHQKVYTTRFQQVNHLQVARV